MHSHAPANYWSGKQASSAKFHDSRLYRDIYVRDLK